LEIPHLPSLTTAEEFNERVVPELLRRWDERCYCRNANFLKLLSFNFEDYTRVPMALLDTERVITNLIFKRFEPVSGWKDSAGGADRADRCPQCARLFRTRYDQYSINMDRHTTRPDQVLPVAVTGCYVAGFRYFSRHEVELQRITDFQPASSVEEFVDCMTA
jgi:hypothetical protein